MTRAQAKAVWTILAEECGATSEDGFFHHQTAGRVPEWRFGGKLGFGGKFWRNRTSRPDGSWGDYWYVNCYAEDETPERRKAIEAANARLWTLMQAEGVA